jgi:hypothetical protein
MTLPQIAILIDTCNFAQFIENVSGSAAIGYTHFYLPDKWRAVAR